MRQPGQHLMGDLRIHQPQRRAYLRNELLAFEKRR
jgi:hypothetical protein